MWDFPRAEGGVVGLFWSSFPTALKFCPAQQCGHGTTAPWPLSQPDGTTLSNETRASTSRMTFPGKFVFFFIVLRRDSLTGHMPLCLHVDLVFMDRAHGVWSANSRCVGLKVKIRNRRGGDSSREGEAARGLRVS